MVGVKLKPVYTAEQIKRRVGELAREIDQCYGSESVVVICVLKGAFMFFSDLVRSLTTPPQIDFVRLASYGHSTEGEPDIRFTGDAVLSLQGKNVLVVEDILDTGYSMDFLFRHLKAQGPESLRLTVLIDKLERRRFPIRPDFAGFALPSGFVVGYGLDYAEQYRTLPAIYEITLPEQAEK